jgi:V/A-type H+-transporting ATPase subunit C
MDASSRYGFINAKLRARIGLMRESHLLQDMEKTSNLVDAVSCMRDTGFAKVAKVYDETGDLQEMEYVLLTGEIGSYQEVAAALDAKPAAFVMQLLGKIEEDNLKNAIRLWFSSIVRLHSIRYRSEYLCKMKIVNDINWNALINATDWKGVVASVKGTFYEPILSSFTQDKIHQFGLFDVETAIDEGWYARLMASLDLLPREDQEVARKIFLSDFDLKNLLNLIRFGWYYRMDAKRLRTTIFPWGRLYGSKEVDAYIASPVDSRDPGMMVKRFYPQLSDEIQKVVGESKEGLHSEEAMARETLRLERYLQNVRSKEYHQLLSMNPFTIAVPLAYFYLYRDMDASIRAILNGKYYGYCDEDIRGVLG